MFEVTGQGYDNIFIKQKFIQLFCRVKHGLKPEDKLIQQQHELQRFRSLQ